MENLLFQSWKINGLELKNRAVLSAAVDNLDNNLSAKITRFETLAQGGVGMIIASCPKMENIAIIRDVVAAVHNNGSKIAIQLATHRGVLLDGIGVSQLNRNNIFFANPFFQYKPHRELTSDEIATIVAEFSSVAKIVQDLGADAVQIHAAHHSLLSQFLSPITNLRRDEWGGVLLNRLRLHIEIAKAIRAATKNFPILIKLGLKDELPNGLQLAEGLEAGEILADYYDALEISQGLQDFNDWEKTPMRTHVRTIKDEAYYRSWSSALIHRIAKPVILTGGIRSYNLVNEILSKHDADAIGLCRPLIREPGLIKRWQTGDLRKATCISCNLCAEAMIKGAALECYLDKMK